MDKSGPPRDVTRRLRETEKDSGAREKCTAGVPLARLISYRFAAIPEIVMLSRRSSRAAARFRALAAGLASADGGGPRVLVVTSPGADEGKSLVGVNLALALAAEAANDVLLLNADFRGASLDRWIRPAPKVGFAELLRGETDLEHVILDLQNAPLKLLPAGVPPVEPAALLASGSGERLIWDLRDRFRWVVIDTAPVEECNDADMIGGWSDGILLVIRARKTRESSFLQAISSIRSAPVLGTVLNDEVESSKD